MKVRIVTIGDEILFGQVVDSNSAFIAQQLNRIGLEVDEIISIHDQHTLIVETLQKLCPDSDLIIMTGGLGPTNDDLTKKALADFIGSEMLIDPRFWKT